MVYCDEALAYAETLITMKVPRKDTTIAAIHFPENPPQ